MTTQRPIINHRQKTLLRLLGAFGGCLGNIEFQKYLFLYTQEFQENPSFEFVPYKFGGFSFQSYADKRRLVEIGALIDSDDWRLQRQVSSTEDLFEDSGLGRCHEKYSKLRGDPLIRDIYRRYPYYAINSEIAAKLMNKQEIEAISVARPHDESMCFFTIGYEGSSFEGYLNRLIRHHVMALVDVRRNPLSRKYGFSKKTLSDTVKKLGIEYIQIPELGIASERRQALNTQADYDRLFDSYERNDLEQNRKSLRQLLDIFLDRKRIAITCFEAQVCMCHRGRVANALFRFPEWKYNIRHI